VSHHADCGLDDTAMPDDGCRCAELDAIEALERDNARR
jgi:hypothetical protein